MLKKARAMVEDKELIQKILLIFLIVQPVLDLYFLFDEAVVNFFGFSPSTIIRILFVGVIGILFLLVVRSKKLIVGCCVYLSIVITYTIIHHLNAIKFTDFYEGYDFGYTLVAEVFYIIRMLMPLFLIIVSSCYNVSDKRLGILVTTLVSLISGSIVVTNLLEISTGSYSKEVIKGNIFDWFLPDSSGLNYLDLASKGFFLDPNRIAALLVLITPILMYTLFKNPSITKMILIFVQMIGMMMLGTKVSTLGFFLILVLSVLLYLFFVFVKKEISFKKTVFLYCLLIALCFCAIYPFAPMVNRNRVDSEMYANERENIEEQKKLLEWKSKIEALEDEEEKKEQMILFVEKNYKSYRLHKDFVYDSYPYRYDPEFWFDIMEMDIEKRVDFRNIERLMLERVKEKNQNPSDDYLGITFARMSNIFDLEKDYLSHYYTLGIVGASLLIGPYIIILLASILGILIAHKKCMNMRNVFLLFGCGISLCSAYFTGNVLDGLVVVLILGFCMGQLVRGVFFSKHQQEQETYVCENSE